MRLYEDPKKAATAMKKIFDFMKWTWDKKIPTRREILDSYMKDIKHFDDKKTLSVQSGRLIVVRVGDTGRMLYGLTARSGGEYAEYCEIHGLCDEC